MMRISVEERLSRLMDWTDTTESLRVLWNSVAREGGIFSARLARAHASQARALGYRYEDPEEIEDELDGDGVMEKSSAWWDDPVSGQPSSLEETVLHLLDSGFSPSASPILAMKLCEVARKAVASCTSKFKVEVNQSCIAFCIPDPCDVLEPGEVYIRSSSRNLFDQDNIPTDTVVGDVLLTRHPCKVASDVQKARAVFKAELLHYVDVIVVSTKGHMVNGTVLDRHLLSMTGGGDYDGDLLSAYWAPNLVNGFVEADPALANKPPGLDTYLIKPLETVAEFQERVSALEEGSQISQLQRYLLSSLTNPEVVGRINKFWENAVYTLSYSDPETIKLAYLFCEALDGSKTGVTVNQQYLNELQKKYSQTPRWKEKAGSQSDTSNLPELVRPKDLGPFVMDELRAQMKKIAGEQHIRIDKNDPAKGKHNRDQDLIAPFKEAEKRANSLSESVHSSVWLEALEQIKCHVKTTRDLWETERSKLQHQKKQPLKKKSPSGGFTDAPIQARQDVLRKVSRAFNEDLLPLKRDLHSPQEWRRLCASYAYIYSLDLGQSATRFPFDVAFRELCAIKAEAVSKGRAKSVVPEFYEGMAIHQKFVRMGQKSI
ncbi:hypothetical protein EUX98_g6245 [Antrodiella citrinella]|uniref:RNA-dependent RNA polymerase n=1 Tax=Antrodiella citrinella TaxID=2447956 RepID=A0A4S4MRN2_9APHY|nr:hypothetical protein EUX98_g6245 [Antrodiella citrinella]